MRSDVQDMTHILTVFSKYLFLELLLLVCLVALVLLLRARFYKRVLDRKEVTAKMLCAHTDVCVSPRFVKTCFYVTLAYEDLTTTVEDLELYGAFSEGKEVTASVVTYSNGKQRLEFCG